MSIIPPSNRPNPDLVEFEDLRIGDFIRARFKDNYSVIQFVVEDLLEIEGGPSIGGTIGGRKFTIPVDSGWEIFMLESRPRIPETYTFGWLSIGADSDPRRASETALGYWRTNLNQNLVEGIVVHSHGPQQRKCSLDLVVEFIPAYATRQSTTPYTMTTYNNATSTNTCTCSAKGACWECR